MANTKKSVKKSRASKKRAAKPAAKGSKASNNVLFEKAPRNYGVGQAIQPRRDLSRFVRWPRYVKLQRQKKILMMRLRVPPSINQFTKTLDKNTATNLFMLLNKYRPEEKSAKRERLQAEAKVKAEGQQPDKSKKPHAVKFGLNHVTALIEQQKAKLVIIAHDVDPIELVVWLPALCRRKGVPFCIVKSKARLGQVVRQKTAACVAITSVDNADQRTLTQLATAVKENYNDKFDETRRQWGENVLGQKTRSMLAKREKALAKEKLSAVM